MPKYNPLSEAFTLLKAVREARGTINGRDYVVIGRETAAKIPTAYEAATAAEETRKARKAITPTGDAEVDQTIDIWIGHLELAYFSRHSELVKEGLQTAPTALLIQTWLNGKPYQDQNRVEQNVHNAIERILAERYPAAAETIEDSLPSLAELAASTTSTAEDNAAFLAMSVATYTAAATEAGDMTAPAAAN